MKNKENENQLFKANRKLQALKVIMTRLEVEIIDGNICGISNELTNMVQEIENPYSHMDSYLEKVGK